MTKAELLNKSVFLKQKGQYDKAIECLKEAEQIDPMDISIYIQEGELFILEKRLDEATEVLEKVLLIDKSNGEVLFHLGNVAILQGQLKEAENLFIRSIANGFVDAQVYVNLSAIEAQNGDIDTAIVYLNKALLIDTSNPVLLVKKIGLLLNADNKKEVLNVCNQLIDSNPDVFDGYHIKALVLLDQNKLEEAKSVINEAKQLFSNSPMFIMDEVRILRKEQKFEDALERLNVLLNSNNEVPIKFFREKVELLKALGRDDEAIILLSQITNKQYDEDFSFQLLSIYYSNNQLKNALAVSDSILEHPSNNLTYYLVVYLKGVILKKTHSIKEAEEHFRDAEKILRLACSFSPIMLDLFMLRALIAKELDEYDNAIDLLDYIQAAADSPKIHEMKSEIYDLMGESEKALEERKRSEADSKIEFEE